MSKRTLTMSAGLLLCMFLLTSGVLAMDSDNYQLDWFTPLTGGGGAASSTSYAVAFTVGQTASGASSSANYGGCLGFWCKEGLTVAPAPENYDVYLPLVLR
jgi:hypothetical protein